jgi:hypothetical protein
MNRKMFYAAVIISVLAALLSQGCGKKSPTTPPNTTPVATIQIDNFEDGDYIDSVGDTVNDLWWGFRDNGTSTNTVGLSGAPGGKYGYYCFAITSTAKATIFTAPLNPYFGFNGMMAKTYTNYATSTGLNLSTYSFFAFGINVHITTPPSGASFKYGIELYNGTTEYVQFDFSQDVVNDRWIDCNLPLSGFTLPPPSAPYSVASVLSNVTEIDFYYLVVGNQNSSGSLEAQIDNVHFDKY